MSKATCRIRQVERSTFDMSPVAVLQVDARGNKSPVLATSCKNSTCSILSTKSNVPATYRTRVFNNRWHTQYMSPSTCRLSTCRTSPIQTICRRRQVEGDM